MTSTIAPAVTGVAPTLRRLYLVRFGFALVSALRLGRAVGTVSRASM